MILDFARLQIFRHSVALFDPRNSINKGAEHRNICSKIENYNTRCSAPNPAGLDEVKSKMHEFWLILSICRAFDT